MFSDFTFGELWEQLAIIALVRQSKCETYIELCELCNWRVHKRTFPPAEEAISAPSGETATAPMSSACRKCASSRRVVKCQILMRDHPVVTATIGALAAILNP